jgi:FAD:protein FMN transferase
MKFPQLGVGFLILCHGLTIQADEVKRFDFVEQHMGTQFRFVLYGPDAAKAETAAKAGYARVAELNRIFSDYDNQSETMRLCKHFDQPNAEAKKVSREMIFVLKSAIALSEKSEGAFDVTIGPVVQLWRLSRRTQKLPNKEELEDARSRLGYQKIILNESNQTVKLALPKMRLDFGGIVKGYAADEVLAIFRKHGINAGLVAAGGDITCMGNPPNEPGWTVEIQPLAGTKTKRTLLLKDQAVSTSGDAENYVLIDGVRYSHIVDPKTGLGLSGERQVTVIAPRGIQADSHTKAALLLEPKRVVSWFETLPGVEFALSRKVADQEEKIESKGFAKLLK